MASIEHNQSAAPLPWRQHFGATLSLGLPLVGAQVAQMGIGVTDAVMIGWLGAPELAAATLATTLFFNVLMFGAGFTYAVLPMVAQSRARGDDRAVRRATRMGLWIVTAFSAAMMVPLSFLEPILIALGQEPLVADLAAQYSLIMQWSLFPALWVMALRSLLSALEHARIVLWATLAAVVFNAILNYALIFGHFGAPRLELQGAAIASVASSMFSFVVLLIYCLWVPAVSRFEIMVRLWRPDWQALGEIARLGLPISLTLVAETGMFAAGSIIMGWYGAATLAAHGIALQISALVFMVPLGFSYAATVRVGHAFALHRFADVKRAALVVLAISVGFSTLSALAFLAFPEPLIRAFQDPADPDAAAVLAQGIVLLAMAASFQLVDGVQATASGLLRGLKDTRIPAMMAVFSYWCVGFPAALVLGEYFGFRGPGVWAGLAIGLAFAAVLLTVRFFRMAARAAENAATGIV
jgi:MATE family multidrug resistance protein